MQREPECKQNKIWVDKGREFYIRLMESWLQGNEIEMYATHNEEKLVATKRFNRTLRKKIYKYMISIFKILYIDKSDDQFMKTIIHILEPLK